MIVGDGVRWHPSTMRLGCEKVRPGGKEDHLLENPAFFCLVVPSLSVAGNGPMMY